MRKLLITTCLLLLLVTCVSAQTVGSWQAYPALSEVENISKAGTTLYVQASGCLYSYNTTDESITVYDKTTALSDCSIKLTAWCQAAERLVIVYENGNIDFLNRQNETINLPDYRNKTMTEDKTVNALTVNGQNVYMATNFGIIKIDAAKAVIADTYNLGFRVDYCSVEGSNLCAQSSTNGRYEAPLTANLLDPSEWKRVGEYIPQSSSLDAEQLALVSKLSPGGPQKNWFHYIEFTHNQLYSCGGYFLSGVAELYRKGTVQVFNGDDWTIYQSDSDTQESIPFTDANALAVDPSNPNHVFVGGKTGLYEFLNGRMLKHYNPDNSPLQAAIDRGTQLDNNYVLVHGLTFDSKGTLWLLNSQTRSTSLMELNAAGEFTLHHDSGLMNSQVSLSAMQSPFFDSRGLLWFVNNNHEVPAIISYNPLTETFNIIKGNLTNQDGTSLSVQYVQCAAEDLDGNIWVGTDAGPFYIPSSQTTESDLTTLMQPKVPRNDGTNSADYLLSNVSITSIAIDGAGRKWFGTNGSGVYLISADGLTQIEHFTAQNSPLLSDDVESIAIDGTSGRVYFGTSLGLCSYVSDATTPATEMKKDSVVAYPNPVHPDYKGLVTIKGLTLDAEIKIVSATGRLVSHGRSNGGTFQWDCHDLTGRRIASGVYFVLTSTSGGSKGTVCKIAVVN